MLHIPPLIIYPDYDNMIQSRAQLQGLHIRKGLAPGLETILFLCAILVVVEPQFRTQFRAQLQGLHIRKGFPANIKVETPGYMGSVTSNKTGLPNNISHNIRITYSVP